MECLFGIYKSIMENVYARKVESSEMNGTHVLNNACAETEQLWNSYQSC